MCIRDRSGAWERASAALGGHAVCRNMITLAKVLYFDSNIIRAYFVQFNEVYDIHHYTCPGKISCPGKLSLLCPIRIIAS